MGVADAPVSKEITLTELIEHECPYYLSIGMTWEQYWEGEVDMIRYFRKADRLRRDRRNEELWLQGFYIHEAMLATPIVVRGYAKKDTPLEKYPAKPHPITLKQLREEEEQQAKAEQQRFREKMRAFADKFNKKRREQNG